MDKRQDRQGVRTPAGLEQKYDFTQFFDDVERRLANNERAQSDFESKTEKALASLEKSAADTNAALSSFGDRLTKTEKNALRLELALKSVSSKPVDLTLVLEKIEDAKKLFSEGLEALSKQLTELQIRVWKLEQGAGKIAATHDGYGNVTLLNVSATHDGYGNVILSGASATHDGYGNVTLA